MRSVVAAVCSGLILEWGRSQKEERYFMNVGGYQWGRVLQPSCSGLILEWRHSRKEEHPRGSGFLGRMSVLEAIDSSEGEVSSGSFIPWKEQCPQKQLDDVRGVPYCLSSNTCLDPGARQKLTTTVCRTLLCVVYYKWKGPK